jgi:O-antigen/teichoic acid export membrane protein
VIKKIIPKSNYSKNVLTLMAGTGLSQVIPIAISPILTRLYTPSEFGVFALFLAVVSILNVIVTGKYELAIFLPKKESEALHLVVLSMFLSLIISCLLFFLILVFNKQIVLFLDAPNISVWLYWIPLSTALMGIYQSLNYWSNRKSHYKRLAVSRVVQSSSMGASQLGGAYGGAAAGGLVAGQLVGQMFATGILANLVYKDDKALLKQVKYNKVIVLAKKYKNFPKFLMISHGFNITSSQMPTLLLSALFSSSATGFFMLTQRVMGAPTKLISSAIGDVFRQEASKDYVTIGNCKKIYIKSLQRLLTLAILPAIGFFFIAPELFELVFGKDWRVAGEYAQILTPVFFLRFITSPLSIMFIIAEKQMLDLIWQILLFAGTSASFYIGFLYQNEKIALMFFSGTYSLLFLINVYVSYKLALNNETV